MMRKIQSVTKQATSTARTKYQRTPGKTTRAYMRFRKALHAKRQREAAKANRSLCVECANEGKHYAPLKVDGHHKQPVATHPELLYCEDNVEFLCKMHHGRHTIQEERGNHA